MMSVLKALFTPYILVNSFASVTYPLSKYSEVLCHLLYSTQEDCSLDWRDQEILMFLCFVIVIKNRRWNPSQWTEYLGNVFLFTKGANMLLFLRKSYSLGFGYTIFCLIIFLIAPEPNYSGPENIHYFRGQALEEEVSNKKHVVYLVEFYATWSSPCNHFAKVFAELSLSYSHEYLKFGKLDVGRYPVVAKRFSIDTTVRSKQLPTLILFINGVEKLRRPLHEESGISWYYRFTKENIIKDFNLNEYYNESQRKLKSTQNRKVIKLDRDSEENN